MVGVCQVCVWVGPLLISISLLQAVRSHETSTATTTISGCLKGSGCSQCPRSRYTLDTNDQMLCCPGCSSAVLYYGSNPTDWCVCYIDATSPTPEGKILKFPGSSTHEITSTNSHPSDFVFGDPHGHGPELRDALYILNQGNDRASPDLTRAVHQAITLMANTIEDLNARLTRLEDIILQIGNQAQTIDRVGTAAGSVASSGSNGQEEHPSQTGGPKCAAKNFTRIGHKCYYMSVWNDTRLMWLDASNACKLLNATLAEPTNSLEFDNLSTYLSLHSTTTGFSYWTGGLYVNPWIWSYSGQLVTLNQAFWKGVDANGKKVLPDDPTPGRCLSFSYMSKVKNFYFAADQCGFAKYYICEYLEKSHRRL